MADAPKPAAFDKAKLNEKLAAVRKYYTELPFKQGHNPHFYLNDVVKPLETRLNVKGETTQELADAIGKLETKVELTDVSGKKPEFLTK